MKLSVKLIDTISGDTKVYEDEEFNLEGWLYVWTSGSYGCDCNRSLLLWDNKALPCNSQENQIKAYLLLSNKEILLDGQDLSGVEKALEAIANIFNSQL